MIAQSWIVNDCSALSVSIHWTENSGKDSAVLFPGLTNSSSDLDYFMSKLARELNKSGITVYQIDPRGHGDSSGEIEEITFETLYEDIERVYEYATGRTNGNVFFVCHGLMGTLSADVLGGKAKIGIISIYPYLISPNHLKKSEFTFNDGIDSSDLEDTFQRNNSESIIKEMSLLGAMGADRSNMVGRILNGKLLEKLKLYNPLESIYKARSNIAVLNKEEGFLDLNELENTVNHYLPRDPHIQERLIALITDKIINWGDVIDNSVTNQIGK